MTQNIARPTKIWDQTLNDWVYLAGVVDTTKSYTYTADQTFPGITATSLNGGPIVGRNFILNGGFDIWQRGTTFTSPADNGFTADRWRQNGDGTKGTRIWSRQSFSPGEIAGYNAQYYMRFQQSVAGSGATYQNLLIQPIEDVRTLSGKTVTISFWAKADVAGRTIAPIVYRFYGTGSPSTAEGLNPSPVTLTTAWQRYSTTLFIPSVVGKTISSSDHCVQIIFAPTFNIAQTIDMWGIQVEEGAVATPFSDNTANQQAELAACQRYFIRYAAESIFCRYGVGLNYATNQSTIMIHLPVEMRALPTLGTTGTSSNYAINHGADVITALSAGPTIAGAGYSRKIVNLNCTVASGLTAGSFGQLISNNNTVGYLDFSAEL
jgi:hypothetical protein